MSDTPENSIAYNDGESSSYIYISKKKLDSKLQKLRHDILNMINSIHGYASLIQLEAEMRKINEIPGQRITDYAGKVLTNIDQIQTELSTQLSPKSLL